MPPAELEKIAIQDLKSGTRLDPVGWEFSSRFSHVVKSVASGAVQREVN
jgi:hypothetical protein